MKDAMVSVSVRKKKMKGKHAKSMTFRATKNGVMSSTSYPMQDEDGNEMPYGGNDEEMIHPTMAHAVKSMKANLGHAFGNTGAPSSKGGDGGQVGDTEPDGDE